MVLRVGHFSKIHDLVDEYLYFLGILITTVDDDKYTKILDIMDGVWQQLDDNQIEQIEQYGFLGRVKW